MWENVLFEDRRDGGRKLAERLMGTRNFHPIVLGLPRGGVPVAYEVARELGAPLDVFSVRKLGVPGHEELAMGAIATGGAKVLNRDLVDQLGITDESIRRVEQREERQLESREKSYRGDMPPLDIHGRHVILVDDGLATGSTMQAAVLAARQMHPASITVASPVGALESCRNLREVADSVVCYATPEPFYAVGRWYSRFDQTSDEEVLSLLARADRVQKT